MSHFVINGERTIDYDARKGLLSVTLPIQFTKTKGKTEITTPTGQPVLIEQGKHPCPELRDALVKSHLWHELLNSGKYRSIKELAEKDKINNKAYPQFIMGLYSLSPDIQHKVLTGKGLDKLHSIRQLKSLSIPPTWSDQSEVIFS